MFATTEEVTEETAEAIRQVIWRMGEAVGWPELAVGLKRFPAGNIGWWEVVGGMNLSFLRQTWLGIDNAIGQWEKANPGYRRRALPNDIDDFSGEAERDCERCGRELPKYRRVHCDRCVNKQLDQLEVGKGTAQPKTPTGKAKRKPLPA